MNDASLSGLDGRSPQRLLLGALFNLSASRRLCLVLPRSCSTGDAPRHIKLWDADLDEAERQSLADTSAPHMSDTEDRNIFTLVTRRQKKWKEFYEGDWNFTFVLISYFIIDSKSF